MKQAIVMFLPEEDSIEMIRGRYFDSSIKPHITLVYPFSVDGKERLESHIKEAIKGIEPFRMKLKGLRKSARGFYVYLLVDEGRDSVIELHDRLNSGVLQGFENPDMPEYIPHLSLAALGSENEREQLISSLDSGLSLSADATSVHLLTLDGSGSPVSTKEFGLQSSNMKSSSIEEPSSFATLCARSREGL